MLKVIFQTSQLKSVFLGTFILICGFFFYVGIFFTGFLKAKQTEYSQARSSWVHVSEASFASERAERVTQIEQTKQIKNGQCERSELRNRASQAFFASRKGKQTKQIKQVNQIKQSQ